MMKRVIYPLLAFFIFFGLWEVSSILFSDQLLVLPAPSSVAMRIWHGFDRLLFHAKVTLGEMLGGFTLALCFSFPLAWIMYIWQPARAILQPFFIFIQCIPMFALAPIMVIWFGWSYTAIVVPTALMIFFPLTISIYQGLRSTPTALLDYFRMNEATRWQTFYKLHLPWSVPYIFSGFRIGTAIAGIGAIAGEWAGAQSGLGILMLESRRATDLETTFGALLFLAFMSSSFYVSILILEKIITRYRPMPSKLFGITLTFFTLFLGGCQQQQKMESARLLLDWLPNPNHVALYVGVEKGFFAQWGIDLNIQKIPDPSDAIPYVSSGQAELALFYMPDTIRAIERGVELKPIGILFKQPLNALIYRADSDIQKPKDLTGKRIGYSVDGSSTTVLDYILEKNHIFPSEKRNVSFDLVSALGTKQVDAVYGAYWNIECEHLRSLGIETRHFDLRSLNFPDYYELIVVARMGSPQATPEFIQAFQSALQESIAYSSLYPKESFEIYLKANPDKSLSSAIWEKAAWEKTYPLQARDQHFDPNVWRTLRTWLINHGLTS